MMEEAKAKQKEHLPTFCVITHDIMSARRVADYINVLWNGRIVEAGPAEDMLNSENPFIRQFLCGRVAGSALDGLTPPARTTRGGSLSEAMVVRMLERLARAADGKARGDAWASCSRSRWAAARWRFACSRTRATDTFVNSLRRRAIRRARTTITHFGGDPVVILIREPLPDLVETKDLATVSRARGVPRRPGRRAQPAAAGVHAGAGRIADALRRMGQPVRQADEGAAGAGRVRAGNVPQPRRRGGQPGDHVDRGLGGSRRCTSARQSAYKLALAAAHVEEQSGRRARTRRVSWPQSSRRTTPASRCTSNSGITGSPSDRQTRSSSRRSCSTRPAG